MIATSDVVVVHNASFDRPFVERRLPEASGWPWICSMNDLDWRELGFEGRAKTHLLAQMGWFYEAHRAETDVAALRHLLDHRLDEAGTVLRRLFVNASQPTWEIEAVDALFAAKDFLRERGYRWNAERRFRRKEVLTARSTMRWNGQRSTSIREPGRSPSDRSVGSSAIELPADPCATAGLRRSGGLRSPPIDRSTTGLREHEATYLPYCPVEHSFAPEARPKFGWRGRYRYRNHHRDAVVARQLWSALAGISFGCR